MSFGGWWRLTLGTAAFVMFAPGALPLFLLPLAALIVAAGARSWAGWVIVGIAATAGLWLAVPRSPATLEAAIGAYMLLASVGFVATALFAPDRFLRQALRATLAGTAGTMLLGLITHGGLSLGELQWDAVRQTSNMARIALIEVPTAWGFKVSDFAPAFETVVRFLSVTWPAQLVLATVAGFALAWQWHVRVARDPLGPAARAVPAIPLRRPLGLGVGGGAAGVRDPEARGAARGGAERRRRARRSVFPARRGAR